jgi:hypothetical protein
MRVHVCNLVPLGLTIGLLACGGKQTAAMDAPDASSMDAPPVPTDVGPLPPLDTGTGPTSCAVDLGVTDATYYASCLPKDLPIPFAFAVKQSVVVSPAAPLGRFTMILTPLKVNATSISDTVGPPMAAPSTPLGDACTFTLNIGALLLPAEANSLDRDIAITDVVLRGKLITSDRSCAELDGVVSLINLTMQGDGDACAFVRVLTPSPLPVVTSSDYFCPPDILPPR